MHATRTLIDYLPEDGCLRIQLPPDADGSSLVQLWNDDRSVTIRMALRPGVNTISLNNCAPGTWYAQLDESHGTELKRFEIPA